MSWRKIALGSALAFALVVVLAMQIQPSAKSIVQEVNQQRYPFSLPALPFAYDTLEPYIDSRTVDVHYSRHHKAYVDALNKAVKGTPWEGKTLDELFSQASKLPAGIRNNGGGHWNHTFYWSILRSSINNPGPSATFQKLLDENFGSYQNFKEQFRQAGLTDFGSGWAWLIVTKDGSLKTWASHNQDNSLMDIADLQGTPLLACDVWEHAYYLKYLNRRDEYMDAFWNIVDWQKIEENYNAAKK